MMYLHDVELLERVRMLGVVDVANVVENLASVHGIHYVLVKVSLRSFSLSRLQVDVDCRRNVIQSFLAHLDGSRVCLKLRFVSKKNVTELGDALRKGKSRELVLRSIMRTARPAQNNESTSSCLCL